MNFASNCRKIVSTVLLYGSVTLAQPSEEVAVASVLCAEAGNQGEIGMVAVGEVIHQQAVEGEVIHQQAVEVNVSIMKVLMKRRAFSCLNGTTLRALRKKYEGTPMFEMAMKVAETVCKHPDQLPGVTHGANHFTKTDEKPYWTRGRLPVAVIGCHSFYKF